VTGAASPRLRFRALRKRFGSREALRGIDLEIEGAQMVGVVGPDGAGKTTLLRAIAGLLEIEAEEASVLGHDLRRDVREYKRLIGYVPQSFSLYRDLSIDENLSFTARLHRIPEHEFQRRRRELLERTSLEPFASRQAGALSGGMKQKLAVANALLPEPDLLILDEPTAGVDVVARREIFEILQELERRVLVIVSTSYLEEAALCDRLVYLRQGRVVAQGSPAELEAATGTDPYRAWTDHGETVRALARDLPWVDGARDCGRFVRVEVERSKSPSPVEVCRTLLSLSPAGNGSAAAASLVALAERAPADLESTLLALARRAQDS
jgi:ABC-2 type transport system ATP-binding protein